MIEKTDILEKIKELIKNQSEIPSDLINYAVKEGIITVMMKPLLKKETTDIRIPELGISATVSEVYNAENKVTFATITNIEFDDKDCKPNTSTESALLNIYSAAKDTDADPEVILESVLDRIIVANWYNKEHIEYWIGEEITDEEYRELIKRWNRYGNFDDINEIVGEFVINEYNEIKKAKHEVD